MHVEKIVITNDLISTDNTAYSTIYYFLASIIVLKIITFFFNLVTLEFIHRNKVFF